MSVNFGDAPHDSNDVQDLWYALREMGFIDADGDEDLDEKSGSFAYGSVTSVTPDATETVAQHTPTSGETQAFRGIAGIGEAAAEWSVLLNGSTVFVKRTNESNPNADYRIDNPIEIDDTDTVELEVKNVGPESSDYNGTLFYRI